MLPHEITGTLNDLFMIKRINTQLGYKITDWATLRGLFHLTHLLACIICVPFGTINAGEADLLLLGSCTRRSGIDPDRSPSNEGLVLSGSST